MSAVFAELKAEYARALADYVANPDEAALQRAYELGRRALAEGVGIVGMALLHHEATQMILAQASGVEGSEDTMKATGPFLLESLAPFEMAHRVTKRAAPGL